MSKLQVNKTAIMLLQRDLTSGKQLCPLANNIKILCFTVFVSKLLFRFPKIVLKCSLVIRKKIYFGVI